MDNKNNPHEADSMQPKDDFQQFQENKNIFKQMFQFSPFTIIIHDMNMNILDVNKMAVEVFGYSREELLQMKVSDLHTKEELEHSFQVLENVNKKDNLNVETSFVRKDGTVFYAEATPFKYKLGNNQLIHVYIQDITSRKEDEIKLVNAMEKAEESDRLKTAFLTNMSHEIRTPMNGILGFVSFLKNPDLSEKDKLKFIDIIEKSGERMMSIIDDIINISKIETGLIETQTEITDINHQIELLYTFYKPEVEKKGITFKFYRPLPSREAIIHTDTEKLIAVLTNMIKNAIKFTEEGTIEFGYTYKNHQFEFFVKDTGIGIPENRLNAIFDRFVQADIADKQARQGFGLGLSISKAYIEMLGGTIWVESREGKGSAFYFTLPRHSEQKTAENKHAADITEQDENPLDEVTGLKILIAEDDEFSYSLLKIMLQGIQWRSITCRHRNKSCKFGSSQSGYRFNSDGY